MTLHAAQPHADLPRPQQPSRASTNRSPRGARRHATHRGRRIGTLVVTFALSITLASGWVPAYAQPDPGTPIPLELLNLVDFDSESAPYPAPPALDGTARSVIDGDFTSQWSAKYTVVDGAGTAVNPMPHWLTLDAGSVRSISGIDYSVKPGSPGSVKDFALFATTSAAVAGDAASSGWGQPVATGSLAGANSPTQIQTVTLDTPVTARYIKFQINSSINGSNNASVSELRLRAIGDPPPPPSDEATPVTITRGDLSVQVAQEFPQIISYTLDGRQLGGQAKRLHTYTLNGTDYEAITDNATFTADSATYTNTFPDYPNVSITTSIRVTEEGTVQVAVTGIEGSAASTINQLSVPNHSLLSVDSSDPAANLARTRISTDSTTTADRFIAITAATATDPAPVGSPYAFVSNTQLAAGLITNATDDSAQDNNDNWNTRLRTQIVNAGNGVKRATLAPGTFTYAPRGASDPRVAVYALPQTTIVLAAELNGDGAVTWQDAAIRYREHAQRPVGADRVAERVVQRIPFNFASQATNPFLKTLDNTKRISLATDNLGQWLLEKGYGSEGHDSAHPDYGGNYNTRAGGLDELNTLAQIGSQYNADIGVHVNATEAYPQAYTFSEALVAGQVNGWDWLNQSYHIDQRKDLGGGGILDRFAALRSEAPGVKTVYIDAYYSSGWLADGLAAQLRELGFEVASEWAYKFEGNSIWSHWASDKKYGGVTDKGINSNIVRFIANSDRDVWNIDPLLGGANIIDFEGWTGQNSYPAMYRNIWTDNLPTKFLQHYQLLNWKFGSDAVLTNGVSVKLVAGKREVYMDGNGTAGSGVLVQRGDTYLLPWGDVADSSQVSSPNAADKMYFYSGTGGSHTFTLTNQFANVTEFALYSLADQGRTLVGQVQANAGTVTLTGSAQQPYVLVPLGAPAPHEQVNFGEASGVADPGFNASTLNAWQPTGDVSLARNAVADGVAVFGSNESSITQHITGLTPGSSYTLSASVEIAQGQRRTVTLGAGVPESATAWAINAFDSTPLRNTIAADAKKGTYSQRAAVRFTADQSGGATIRISAAAGSAAVTLDDVRVMPDTSTTFLNQESAGAVIVQENFEGNQPGWGPFVKGDAGGATDPRTSISERHEPYSQRSWKNTYSPYKVGALAGLAVDDVLDGEHSLKSQEENT